MLLLIYQSYVCNRFEKELDALRKELEASSSNGDADDDVSTAKPECEESNGKNPSSKKDS